MTQPEASTNPIAEFISADNAKVKDLFTPAGQMITGLLLASSQEVNRINVDLQETYRRIGFRAGFQVGLLHGANLALQEVRDALGVNSEYRISRNLDADKLYEIEFSKELKNEDTKCHPSDG